MLLSRCRAVGLREDGCTVGPFCLFFETHDPDVGHADGHHATVVLLAAICLSQGSTLSDWQTLDAPCIIVSEDRAIKLPESGSVLGSKGMRQYTGILS